jgi:vacuolar protein sorting-associated protein 29
MLVPGKMQHVICTGNISGGCAGSSNGYESEEYQRLKDLVGGGSANVHCVAGEYDFLSSVPVPAAAAAATPGSTTPTILSPSFPETKVIQLGQFRVGIIGGHQIVPHGELHALSMTRRKLNVDILVCGWRRQEGVVEFDGEFNMCVSYEHRVRAVLLLCWATLFN